jgi:undecaprenyl-diphosphatase
MDLDHYRTLNGLAGSAGWLDHLLRWGAQDLPIAMAIVVGLAWFWPGDPDERAQRQRLAVYAVGAALLGLALSQAIGHAWFRERPYVHHPAHLLVAPSGDPSFPSDHAVGGFALAIPFVLARRRVGWLLLAMATVLAMTRVAVGTHYPSDVIGGAFLGTAAAVAIWRVRPWLEIPLVPCLLIARRIRLA